MKAAGAALPRMDAAPKARAAFADSGLGRGWEPAVLILCTFLLLGFGLVNLYSASAFMAQEAGLPDYHYVLRQAGGAALGVLAMVICARIPYHWWRYAAWPLLGLAWVLLVLTVLPWTHELAPVRNGARRWLELGVTVQPAELAKVAVVAWTAMMAVRKEAHFKSLTQGLLPFLLVWAVLLIPILLQPDLSTAALVAALGVMVAFMGGARPGHFAFLGLLLLPLMGRYLESGFRQDRMAVFAGEATGAAGYQTHQALVTLGSGGLSGAGFGEGRQKFGFLPEPHNDFIFAMIGEEWGFMGTLILLALYSAVVLVGFRIAGSLRDRFGQLLAAGLTAMVGLQALLHIGVSLGLFPPTGLPLPLVSYGRSSLVVTLVAMGILLSLSRPRHQTAALRAPEVGRAG